jgi:Tol biopolymer transport system component
MRADGTQKHLVYDGGLSLSLNGWSPDGCRLLFTGRAGRLCNGRLHAVSIDTGEVVRYTGGPPCAASADASREGVWSQDGQEVAFVRPDDNEIWVSRADGTNARRLLSVGDSVGEIATGISGSIAFTTGSRIEAVDWDGSNRRILADLATDRPFELQWSPEGSELLFTRDDGNFPYELFAVNDDGSGLARIAGDVTSGVWSPDGRQVAFTGLDTADSYPDDQLHSYSYALFRVNVDGTGRTQLTSTPDGHHVSDWQAIPGPKRGAYKNRARFCKAEQGFWGHQFASRYGGGANAYGKCVSGSE